MINKQPFDKHFPLNLKHRRSELWGLGFALVCTLCGCAVQQNNHWVGLFNGKDLEGWKVKITGHELNDNYGNTFRVEDVNDKMLHEGYIALQAESHPVEFRNIEIHLLEE